MSKNIIEYLNLKENRSKLDKYFDQGSLFKDSKRKPKEWSEEYFKKYPNRIDHDEPWLTLLGLYSVFGDQSMLNDTDSSYLLKELFDSALHPPTFETVSDVTVEVILPEIRSYSEYLKSTFLKEGAYHPYPDRKSIIEEKLNKEKMSLEGNTNLDALISGSDVDGKDKFIFIEAKYLADVSKDTTYNTVRDQIIRNIDAAIYFMRETNDEKNPRVDDFWFYLLTPGIFRTKSFGGPTTNPLKVYRPEKSRLYCYKMEEYLEWRNIRDVLPHQHLKDEEWETIANHIGWFTFEEMMVVSKKYSLIPDAAEKQMIYDFFAARFMI